MRSLRIALGSLALTLALPAQTLGVAGVNDYWITGGTPGGLSCKALTLTTPLAMQMNVSCGASQSYVIFWSTCTCKTCSPIPPIGLSACLPPPTTACPSSNQFLELGILGTCTTFTIAGVGPGSLVIPVPMVFTPVTLSSQTVILGPPPCLALPFLLLFSQAWNVTFV